MCINYNKYLKFSVLCLYAGPLHQTDFTLKVTSIVKSKYLILNVEISIKIQNGVTLNINYDVVQP